MGLLIPFSSLSQKLLRDRRNLSILHCKLSEQSIKLYTAVLWWGELKIQTRFHFILIFTLKSIISDFMLCILTCTYETDEYLTMTSATLPRYLIFIPLKYYKLFLSVILQFFVIFWSRYTVKFLTVKAIFHLFKEKNGVIVSMLASNVGDCVFNTLQLENKSCWFLVTLVSFLKMQLKKKACSHHNFL